MSPAPKLPALLLRTQSDERLLALASEGHERAFEAIVERYRKPLLQRCKRLLSSDRAEDAVQQTFLGTWKALEQGTEIRELRAWLYRSALNHSLNTVKSAGYDYSELRESLAGGALPEADAERKLVMRETLAGIAALPERQREALLQTAVQGRSHAEVAEEFGMTDTAVRQLVHRARVSLRAAATAVTPLPLMNWALAAASQGGGEPIRRIAEIAGGAGGVGAAGISSAIVKGGAVVAVVAAVATPGGIGTHATRDAKDGTAQASEPAKDKVDGAAGGGESVAGPAAGLSRGAIRRSEVRGARQARAERRGVLGRGGKGRDGSDRHGEGPPIDFDDDFFGGNHPRGERQGPPPRSGGGDQSAPRQDRQGPRGPGPGGSGGSGGSGPGPGGGSQPQQGSGGGGSGSGGSGSGGSGSGSGSGGSGQQTYQQPAPQPTQPQQFQMPQPQSQQQSPAQQLLPQPTG